MDKVKRILVATTVVIISCVNFGCNKIRTYDTIQAVDQTRVYIHPYHPQFYDRDNEIIYILKSGESVDVIKTISNKYYGGVYKVRLKNKKIGYIFGDEPISYYEKSTSR